MPDDLGLSDNSQAPQTGGQLNGGSPGISGGSGVFHSLISTMLSGMAARATMGGKAALAQNQGTPYARSMAAGINAPEVAQQKKVQQQQQADESTERQQRIALTKVQYLQAKHALSVADDETKKDAHDVARNWADKLYQDHKLDWEGGTSANPAELADQQRRIQQQYPNDLVMTMPIGASSHGSPTYGVAHIKNGSLSEAATFSLGGHPEAGIPPKSVTVNAGTGAIDGTTQVTSGLHKGIIASEASKLTPSDGLAMPQISPEELRSGLQEARKPIPENLDELWSVAQGSQSLKDLPKKSSWEGNQPVIGQDLAQQFIRNFSPNFDPDKMTKTVEMRKTLEKAENSFALDNGKDAGQAMEDAKEILEQKGGGSPEIVQRAQKLIDKAKPWMARYQASLQQKDDNKDFEHQKTLFDQRQNDGVDQNGVHLSLQEASMDQPVDGFGNPIANKKITAYKPGQMQQNTAATATVLLSKLDQIEQVIKSNPTYIGPIGGSVGELKQHFGLSSGEAQKLYDNISTVQSGFTKMHTSRFSNEILQKAVVMLNPRMNRDAAIGAIASMRDTAQLYEKDDKLMSKADYIQNQQAQKDKLADKAKVYLQKAGWTGGKPTDAQKQQAAALAKAEGQDLQ